MDFPSDDDFETAFTGPAERFEAEYDFKRPKNADGKQLIIAASGRGGGDARAEEAARFLRSPSPSMYCMPTVSCRWLLRARAVQ